MDLSDNKKIVLDTLCMMEEERTKRLFRLKIMRLKNQSGSQKFSELKVELTNLNNRIHYEVMKNQDILSE